ncbi:MAG: NADH-quinone oxidoreductase subunit NuoH [Vampirovibrionales bacterium]
MLLAWGVLLFILISIVAKAAVVFMVLMERKVLAWVTQRKGPNRVGPFGILQTVADGVKLLFKEDIMTPGQDKFLFTLAPALFIFPVFVLFAFVPFTDYLTALDMPVGALLIFALSSISMIGIVLAGWASNNKYSLLGGMRSAAQAISYEIPLILSVLAVVLFTGSMNLSDIVAAQLTPLGPLGWYWFYLTPIPCLIFLVSSIAEVNRIPFDLPEAESELVSGYNTEYSGMKFAMFFLAEYAALFVMCALMVVFFFGGYHCPLAGITMPWGVTIDSAYISTPLIPSGGELIPLGTWIEQSLQLPGIAFLLDQMEKISWMVIKIYGFIFLAMWLRGTLPRLKPDQLMGFSWKFLMPLALINLFLVGIQRMWAYPNASLVDLTTAITQHWGYLVVWAILLIGGVGGFCIWTSNTMQAKLKARFAP